MAIRLVNIAHGEYEKRRHAFELCQWINEKLAELEHSGNFDLLYFERKGKNVKKLIEEAIPVSRLALQLSTPGSEVYVTCHAGNQAYDATLEIAGFGRGVFKVEVTTTETDETVLRRQALSREGNVAFSGPIGRDNKDKRHIVWEGEMVDVDADERRCIELMFERLQTKIDSGSYGDDTVILVHLAEYRPISMRNRAKLVQRTSRYMVETQPRIGGVYYSYTGGYIVDAVGPHEV